MTRVWRHLGVPLLIAVVGAGGAYYLVGQDRARQMTTKEATVPTVAAGPPKASVGGQAAVPPQGGVIRSLDKINAAAAAVGCQPVVPGDPAGHLLDLAECLGDKAVARRAKEGGVPK